MAVRIRAALAACTALAVLASAPVASSSTIVFGNGFAAQCARDTIAGRFNNEVLKACDSAIEEEFLTRGDFAKTLVNRGVVHLRRKNLTVAGKDFSRAQETLPSLPEIYINRAVIMIKQGKFDDAIVEVDRGIALKPDELEKAYFNRALAKEAAGDVKGAYLDYSRALQLRPDWEPAMKELARFTVQKG